MALPCTTALPPTEGAREQGQGEGNCEKKQSADHCPTFVRRETSTPMRPPHPATEASAGLRGKLRYKKNRPRVSQVEVLNASSAGTEGVGERNQKSVF